MPCGLGGCLWDHCGFRTPLPPGILSLGLFICLLSKFLLAPKEDMEPEPFRLTWDQRTCFVALTRLVVKTHMPTSPPTPDGINTWSCSPRKAALHTSGSWAVSALGFVQCESLSTRESMVTFKFCSGSLDKDTPPWNHSPWFPWQHRGSQDTVTSNQVIPSLI